MTPSVDLVIVNWNTGPLLRECLESIPTARSEAWRLGSVVVVDNASTDKSAEQLDTVGLPVNLVKNAENLGFAFACNQGAHRSTGDFLLFLNPDARLFADSLDEPMRFFASNPRAGICGVGLVDDDGTVQRTCRNFPSWQEYVSQGTGLATLLRLVGVAQGLEGWAHDEARAVDQLIGAFFLVRRSVFEALGGFDEEFFVYFEEVDFSLRARKKGWESWFLPKAHAYHRGHGSSDQVRARRLFYSLRSRLIYSRKHFDAGGRVAVAASTLLVEPWTRLAAQVVRRSGRGVADTVEGYALLLWHVLKRGI